MNTCTYSCRVVVLLFVLAIGSGASGTILTRASDGFRRPGYSLGAIAAYGVATVVLALLLQRLPVGIVYAVWTGSAAVVLLAIDRIAFQVRTSGAQLVGVAITIVGVALLGTAVQA